MAEWLPLTQVVAHAGLADRPVARVDGVAIHRSRFLADVRAWQASFSAVSGPQVALHFEDTYAFVCALFGAWHAGKQVRLPGDTQPATLARLLPDVDACAGDLPGAMQPAAHLPAAAAAFIPLDPQRTRLVVHTSGSSGDPLAIAKTLAQLDAEVHTLETAFGAPLADARVFATVSHQHIYGLLFHALWPLAAGRALVSTRLHFPEQMADQLAGHPSVLVTSPAHLKRLPDTLDWRAARASLVAVFSSGGPLPADASTQAHQVLGQSPTEVFGSSETGGIAWRQRALHGDRWTPLPGISWRTQGDHLLAVRSPHLPDDHWFVTADLIDADGNGFLLRGRADRVVKVEEKRISLTALEQALLAAGDLAEARVIVLPDDGGTRLAVVGVPSAAGRAWLAQGKRVLNDRLRDQLLQGVERVALPRRFRYVDQLPANAQGKTPLAALQALFRPHLPPVEWTAREPLQAVARMVVDADLLVFDGHFDGLPVLPGVAQLDWAVHFGRECFPLPAHFVRLDALKFQRPVLPGTTLQLSLTWRPEKHALSFTYTSEAGPHAGGSVVFAADAHD